MILSGFYFKPKLGGVIKLLSLEEWYNSLTQEEQRKAKDYSGQNEDLIRGEILSTSQSQKHFFWTTATNAIHRQDYDFAISLAQKGLQMKGSPADQHFLYSALIEAFESKGEYEQAKGYCRLELREFSKIGSSLRSDFNGELPPSIACRDTLLRIVIDIEQNYEEGRHLLDLFVEKELLTPDEAQRELRDLNLASLYSQAENFLKKGMFEDAKSVFDELTGMDASQADSIYKLLGDYLFEHQRDYEAFQYYQKAISTNPLVSGVRTKLRKLSKKLGVEFELNEEEISSFLMEKEKIATEWWSRRDLANEYVRIGQYDHAWRLFNEAIVLRSKQGMPCDTIYPHMAKMLEKEDRHKEALFNYLLAYRELRRFSLDEPPRYLTQGINRCLGKLGSKHISHIDLYDLVDKTTDPRKIQESLQALLG